MRSGISSDNPLVAVCGNGPDVGLDIEFMLVSKSGNYYVVFAACVETGCLLLRLGQLLFYSIRGLA